MSENLKVENNNVKEETKKISIENFNDRLIQVKNHKIEIEDKPIQNEEIVVYKEVKKVEYKKGARIETIEYQPKNVSKKLKETAKVINEQNAQDRLKEISKLIGG